jgi:hypothetical protein
MPGGEFVDRRGDPRGIETFVGFGPGRCHNAIHGLTGYRTAPMLSLIILGWRQVHARFDRLQARLFPPRAAWRNYFPIDVLA